MFIKEVAISNISQPVGSSSIIISIIAVILSALALLFPLWKSRTQLVGLPGYLALYKNNHCCFDFVLANRSSEAISITGLSFSLYGLDLWADQHSMNLGTHYCFFDSGATCEERLREIVTTEFPVSLAPYQSQRLFIYLDTKAIDDSLTQQTEQQTSAEFDIHVYTSRCDKKIKVQIHFSI